MMHRTEMDEIEINENLKIKTSMSQDESVIYFNVDYMQGQFTIEKTFKNNYFGVEELEITMKELDSEKKVRKYLRLGDK